MIYTSGLWQLSDHCYCGSKPEEHSLDDYQPHMPVLQPYPPRDDVNPILRAFRDDPSGNARAWAYLAVSELADGPSEDRVPVLNHAIRVLDLLAIMRRTA